MIVFVLRQGLLRYFIGIFLPQRNTKVFSRRTRRVGGLKDVSPFGVAGRCAEEGLLDITPLKSALSAKCTIHDIGCSIFSLFY